MSPEVLQACQFPFTHPKTTAHAVFFFFSLCDNAQILRVEYCLAQQV